MSQPPSPARAHVPVPAAHASEGDWDWQRVVMVVGDTGTGKTCLCKWFRDGSFDAHTTSSVGIDYFTAVLPDHRLRLQLWDSAGRERFRDITTRCVCRIVGHGGTSYNSSCARSPTRVHLHTASCPNAMQSSSCSTCPMHPPSQGGCTLCMDGSTTCAGPARRLRCSPLQAPRPTLSLTLPAQMVWRRHSPLRWMQRPRSLRCPPRLVPVLTA